jgi:hypothetical protein
VKTVTYNGTEGKPRSTSLRAAGHVLKRGVPIEVSDADAQKLARLADAHDLTIEGEDTPPENSEDD